MSPVAEGGARRLRPPVAVLLSRFPRVTETFILREVVELERQGQPVLLVPLIRERPPVVHPEARPWLGRALFTPWLSPAVVWSNLRLLARRPGAWLACLARLVRGMAASPGFLARSLALFPKAVHLAERMAGEGVVHVHAHFATHPATVAWVVERLADIPWSVTVHAHDLFVRRTMLREKLGRARFVRAISRYNREYLEQRYPEVAERVAVVHVGVEPERYRRGAEAPAGGGAAGREVRVLTVAALERYKGIGVLVEAADLLRKRLAARPAASTVTWEVVGAGSLRVDLEGEIARRGLAEAVRLAGALPQDEVARRLARADLFVLPSVVAPDGQMEGIPVALMEAMAAGRPVVASDLSGIPELVADGETGLLVPPGDAGALAEAVGRLLEEPGLGARLGEAGRRRVEEEFRLAATVKELLALLDRETAGWHELGPEVHPDLTQAVRELLTRAGLASRPAGVRRVHEGPDSRVAELLVGAGGNGGPPVELVAKLHRNRPGQSAPPAERARREHEALARLEGAGRGGPHGVPRPLALADASPALLLERARGVPLDRLIRELRLAPGRSARARLEDAFRRAGGWLRWFRGEVGEGVRHGDFWPGNVYVADGRVEVIDLEGCGPPAPGGPPEDDAAWFLRHTRLYFRLPGLGRRFRALERAFLEGLRGTSP